METDRRGHTRFLVQDDVVVAVRNGFTKIGRVKDIGRGGLSFEHIYENSTAEVPKTHVSLWVNTFFMSDLPCRIVYDIPVPTPEEYSTLAIRLATRRCGVQFETLAEDQRAQLDSFLRMTTQGEAP